MTYDPFKSVQENLAILDEGIQNLKKILKDNDFKKSGHFSVTSEKFTKKMNPKSILVKKPNFHFEGNHET